MDISGFRIASWEADRVVRHLADNPDAAADAERVVVIDAPSHEISVRGGFVEIGVYNSDRFPKRIRVRVDEFLALLGEDGIPDALRTRIITAREFVDRIAEVDPRAIAARHGAVVEERHSQSLSTVAHMYVTDSRCDQAARRAAADDIAAALAAHDIGAEIHGGALGRTEVVIRVTALTG